MQTSENFERVLEQLYLTDPPEAALHELSNLHGSELDRLTEAWSSVPAEQRQSIVERLVEIGEADFEMDFSEVFKLGLDDAEANVRALAIEGLWEVEDSALVRPLVHLFREDSAIPVREAAAISMSRFALMGELGRLQPRLADMVWEALWEAIHNPGEDLSVRRRAIESLAYFDRPEVTQVIERAYEDDETRMRVSAVFAMGRSADQEWAEKVLLELESDEPEMRYEATRACGELQLIEATSILSLLVHDDDPEVKFAAVWSLGQIGTPEARRVLEECADEGDEALQDAAEEALDDMDLMQGDIDFSMYEFDPDAEDEDEEAFWDDEDLLA
jgi:HEAT repeat protein